MQTSKQPRSQAAIFSQAFSQVVNSVLARVCKVTYATDVCRSCWWNQPHVSYDHGNESLWHIQAYIKPRFSYPSNVWTLHIGSSINSDFKIELRLFTYGDTWHSDGKSDKCTLPWASNISRDGNFIAAVKTRAHSVEACVGCWMTPFYYITVRLPRPEDVTIRPVTAE